MKVLKKIKEPQSIIIAGLFGFIGVTVGAFSGAYFEKTQWEREANFTERKTLLNKRLDLLERTITVINKRSRAKSLNSFLEAYRITFKSNSDIASLHLSSLIEDIKSNKTTSKTKEDTSSFDSTKLIKSYSEIDIELENLSTEFHVTMSLNALYFGDETKESIKDLSATVKRWWLYEEADLVKIYLNMNKELHLFNTNIHK